MNSIEKHIGANISKQDRDEWLEEVMSDFRKDGLVQQVHYVTSGDTIVIGINNGDNTVDVYDTKIRRKGFRMFVY